MAAKPCVACNRLIAASFAQCSFCGADQPTPQAPAPKETRCTTCKRPYAAKLAECPFCARDRAAGAQPEAFGATRSLRPALPASTPSTDDGDEDAEPRVLGSAAIVGAPLLIGAVWGIAQVLTTPRLGGQESSGTIGTSLVIALFVAPLLAAVFVRRTYRTLSGAVEQQGFTKVLVVSAAASVMAFVPAALSTSGLIYWFNGFGVDDRAQMVDCKVGSVWHHYRKGTDMGWRLSYACDVEGEHLLGTAENLRDRPDAMEGGTVRFRAVRGRLGYWLRLSDPVPPSSTVVR